LRYDFKKKRIVPTHYTIRTNGDCPGDPHLKSWLFETSADGESWRKVAGEEGNRKLNNEFRTGSGEYCFIRLVNISRNHFGQDNIFISAWEIFGGLIE
jgi:hypothetical protein